MIGRTNALTIIGGAGGGDLEIELPSELIDASKNANPMRPPFPYFKLDEDTYLISTNFTNFANVSGLYLYKVSTKNWEKKANFAPNFFYQIGSKCLLSGDTDASGANSGLCVYNSETETVTWIYKTGKGYKYVKSIGNGKYLLTAYSSAGLLLYDYETDTVTNLSSSIKGDIYVTKINDNYLINGLDVPGLWLFNPQTETITQIYTTGNYNGQPVVVGGKVLIATFQTAGVRIYDPSTGSITQISTLSLTYPIVVGTKCLISGNSSSVNGIYLYDSYDDSLTQIYTTGYSWRYGVIVGRKCLVSSSSTTGLLLFNPDDNSITQKLSSGRAYQYSYTIQNYCLICGTYSTDNLLVYNITTDKISSQFGTGDGLFITIDENSCLAVMYYSIYHFDASTGTLEKLFAISGSVSKTFEKYEEDVKNPKNYYLWDSDKNTSGIKVYYDNSTKTVRILSFTI